MPRKTEAMRVATRHDLPVYLVSNSRLNMVVNKNVHKIIVGADPDAADNWIAEQIEADDIVVTVDILLADRCLKKGAHALSPTGKVFNDDNIGIAKAMRELHTHLRETGVAQNNNPGFSKQNRSHFLQVLEKTIQAIKKNSSKL